ncbi:MAG: UvrB/UvrC motif-containing protein [Candidatus Latescibacteria bacterium]|nr:UvrB/UvrC motif-containing protein [Candidatus Latescibacterota bacterium]
MPQDLDHLLREWEYDPQANVRRIWGEDGAQKLQVRVDQGAFQGIMQMNLDGRPDGKRPYGFEFTLDYYREALEKHLHSHGGQSAGFTLDRAACQELFDEGSRVYGRYVFLLQLKDYQRVIRDTERNMGLFRFVNAHAEAEEDRTNLEKWWPYILRINATARALKIFQDKHYAAALEVAAAARTQIEQLPEVQAEEFFVERERSLQALDELAEELRHNRPLSQEELLEQELQDAIAQEKFERAAALRDQLRQLRGGQG